MKHYFGDFPIPEGLTLRHILRGYPPGTWISQVAWSPDGMTLACSTGTTVILWNTENGELRETLQLDYGVERLAWSPGGRLAIGGTKGKDSTIVVKIWDMHIKDWSGNELSAKHELPAYRGMDQLQWSPSLGRFLATTISGVETIWIWDLWNGGSLDTLQGTSPISMTAPPETAPLEVNCLLAAHGPDFNRAVGPTVQIWTNRRGRFREHYASERTFRHLTCLAWSPDGRYLASAAARDQIAIWNTKEKKLCHLLPSWPKDGDLSSDNISSLAWSPDRQFLASGAKDGTVHVWDLSQDYLLSRLDTHLGKVSSVAWLSKEGWLSEHPMLASVSGKYLSLWSNKSRDPVLVLPALEGLDHIPWHSGYHRLVTPGHRRGDLCIWELDLLRLSQPGSKTFSVATQKMNVPEKGIPINIYISYNSTSTADQELQQRLERQLHTLQLEGLVKEIDSTNNVLPGTEPEKKNEEHLNAAQIILLLISPDFLSSSYSYETEMKRALELEEQGKAYVIPVLMRPVEWKNLPPGELTTLGKLRFFPPDPESPDGKFIARQDEREQEETMRALTKDIRGIVKTMRSSSSPWKKGQAVLNSSDSSSQRNALLPPPPPLERLSVRTIRASKEWREAFKKHGFIFFKYPLFFTILLSLIARIVVLQHFSHPSFIFLHFFQFLASGDCTFVVLATVVYAFVQADRNGPKEAKYKNVKIRAKAGYDRPDKRGEFTLLPLGNNRGLTWEESLWTDVQDVLRDAQRHVEQSDGQ